MPRRELTIEQIAALLDAPARTVRFRAARWERDGWPRVRRAPCRGSAKGRMLVDAEDFDAYCAGEPRPEAVDDAA